MWSLWGPGPDLLPSRWWSSQLTISGRDRRPSHVSSHPHNTGRWLYWEQQSRESSATHTGVKVSRTPSDWSGGDQGCLWLVGTDCPCILCCCSDQMSPGHRYQVHIRAEFNILTLSNRSLSQIDCHPSPAPTSVLSIPVTADKCWH